MNFNFNKSSIHSSSKFCIIWQLSVLASKRNGVLEVAEGWEGLTYDLTVCGCGFFTFQGGIEFHCKYKGVSSGVVCTLWVGRVASL